MPFHLITSRVNYFLYLFNFILLLLILNFNSRFGNIFALLLTLFLFLLFVFIHLLVLVLLRLDSITRIRFNVILIGLRRNRCWCLAHGLLLFLFFRWKGLQIEVVEVMDTLGAHGHANRV